MGAALVIPLGFRGVVDGHLSLMSVLWLRGVADQPTLMLARPVVREVRPIAGAEVLRDTEVMAVMGEAPQTMGLLVLGAVEAEAQVVVFSAVLIEPVVVVVALGY